MIILGSRWLVEKDDRIPQGPRLYVWDQPNPLVEDLLANNNILSVKIDLVLLLK